MKSAQDNNVIN